VLIKTLFCSQRPATNKITPTPLRPILNLIQNWIDPDRQRYSLLSISTQHFTLFDAPTAYTQKKTTLHNLYTSKAPW
jgi:hypothetical protein